ncbi:sensor histidine kinase [Actinocatenispora rupis]|uniref:histidine kinase n=1 Tax=Actinocatenispora rupis TaxID=519421 RepID=A0A8J3NDA3_9ACTN|nr:HAMP domain-containing sensor histidine kinase [Actinocatenispora rupis]GID11279.1 two-component sensor histidine kinase [Actinocatenispora rupis]
MRRRPVADGPEERLIRRGRWVLTGQIAAIITVVVLLVGAIAWGLMVRGQYVDGRRELAGSLSTASVTHPWPCVWMFERRGTTTLRTPAAPDALPVTTDLTAVSRQHPVLVARHRVGGIDYLVRTEWHPGRVAQATLDLRYQATERDRLYLALALAEVAGLLGALAGGRLLSGRAIRPLAEALRRQRSFVADASHELRTPLTQIHTRAQLLERRLHSGADPAVLAEDTARVVAGTRQFGEVLDDLLLAAQLGPDGAHPVPVDLAGLVREVAAAESARTDRRGLTLTVDVPESCPVTGVAASLRRVVNALVDNAIGHTPAGGTVTLTLAYDSGEVVLRVADDGVGLDPGEAERIFARFARGEHGAGRRFGLGLALVREVVTSHGGTIAAAGTPGRGATFTVRLPAAPVVAGAGRRSPALAQHRDG